MEKEEKQKFTRVPNEFLDQAAHLKLPIQCMQCLIFIIRQSWGWNRKTVKLRIKDIAAGTGLRPPNVIKALKRLENDKIIVVIPIDNKHAKNYRINYKYELSRQPEEMLSTEITHVIPTDNKRYPYGQQNVIPADNNNSRNPATDKSLRRPKEIKEILKKNKESARAKEPKKDSLASLHRKPMTEAEMQQRAELLRQQAKAIRKANRPSEREIINKLNAERMGTDMPNYGFCSVCGENKKLSWNTGGYLICFECGKEDWLEKVFTSYDSS